MSTFFVSSVSDQLKKENAMSCVQYENFQIEQIPVGTQEPKPLMMMTAKRAKSADPAARVAEVLDLVFANGSMPA
jgi:hypothetical protein